MKKVILLLLVSLSIQSFAQNPLINNSNGNRDGMLWFDLSALNWVDAFDSLNTILQERYPYTEWKSINWDLKKNQVRPKIVEAQNEGDPVMHTETLFEYLYSVPDGHVMYRGDVGEFRQARMAGTFGINMIPITDGSIVANIVAEGGPAWMAGIRSGDEILLWNGMPILNVPELEVYNNFGGLATNYATEDGRLISRYEVLSRDSVGAEAEVTFQSHATGSQQTVVLTSISDDYALMMQAYFLTIPMPDFDSVVTYKILDDQIGYLRILHEGSDAETIEAIRQDPIYLGVKEAIAYFIEHNINKLIIDLRFNAGGNDLLGSAISGFFLETPDFYEYVTGTSDDGFAIIDSIITVPESPLFGGEVVVMVSPNCISTGEGIPMMIQRLPNGRVISFWGTNGSFGIVPNAVFMTDSLQYILFPYARSLTHDQVIQLDSDSLLVGGVQPDIKIPLTVERVIEQWQEGKDVELEYAISTLLDIPEVTLQKEYRIYPNPADALVHIKYDSKKPITIWITDVNGRLVKLAGEVISGQAIDISSLPAGLYFLTIDDNKRYRVEKLLIQ
ncbi:MAG: T9SS type A sorting domain-containing protein [Bacteroidales bacterium]|nr:T9SS type A sorting domain-containing protein [Bacteroidales bacterium]